MEIAEVLRKNGYKVTPQRLAVYEAINHNPTHPNAEAIYKILQPNYPSMSLATVYKTIDMDQEGLRQQAAEQSGFVVNGVSISFVGICPECREKS